MKPLLNDLGLLMDKDLWWAQVFAVVFLMLIINFLQKRLLKHAIKKAEKSRNNWDDIALKALQRPLTILIWVLGLSFAADIIYYSTQTSLFKVAPTVRSIGVVVSVALFAMRFLHLAERLFIDYKAQRQEPIDETTITAIDRLLRLAVVITAGLMVLQSLGVNINGILAFGGISGIAVGFAAKDMLANFFGGLMIYLDRPFSVGDWIRSPDKNIEGTVEHIGWRLTRIIKFNKTPLYIPNSMFSSLAVENPSRMTNRRIKETIGIRYQDAAKMRVIVEEVKQMLLNHEAIDIQKTLIVNFNRYAASSMDFFIYAYTKTTQWVEFHEIKQEILLKVLDIVERHGAEVAFPTSTLHIEDSASHELPTISNEANKKKR